MGGNTEAEVVLYQPDSRLLATTLLSISEIFNESELDEDSVCKESLRTAEMVFFEGGFYRKWRKESHDRWLVVDDKLYHCGHSLNANGGHKISAITLMGTSPEVVLGQVR